jgi:hypothetical protein
MAFGDKPAAEPQEEGVRFVANVVGGDQAMLARLARYPNLVHAPQQWGEGIRTHLKGALVEQLAKELKAGPLLERLMEECEKRGLDMGELCDAIRFARDTGLFGGKDK